MLLVGLTGGIGSGKTTVADLLRDRGAVVLDADAFAREALDPGSPGAARVVEAFGQEAMRPDGSLDREELARRVFADPEGRRTLEAIVHPEVARRFAAAVEPLRDTDAVVVYVVPLLVERGLESGFDVVVVVTAPVEVRVARVVAARGMSADDARARMAAQATDEQREAAADVVVPNDRSRAALAREVERLWEELARRRPRRAVR